MNPVRPIPGATGRAASRLGAALLCLVVLRSEGAPVEPTHWAFKPLRPAEPPPVRDARWPVTAVDRFILADLEAHQLAPAPRAGREQLLRRVTLDLIGLPPTLKEIDAFLSDSSPRAWETIVGRLLASPHYGERWGRHWLDLARFAESDGFEHDAVRPDSWRYRDYVVRAFNADKPYDRFIREQLAGDELWPEEPDALIATGFNLLGPDMVDSSEQLQRRHNTLNDMTDTGALAFLGLTMGCARCHDHKFEPLTQRDYFRLQAFFTPVAFRRDLTIATHAERATHAAAQRKYEEQTRADREELAQLEAPHRERLLIKKLAALPEETRSAHLTPPDQRTTEQENLVLETEKAAKITEAEMLKSLSAAERARQEQLQSALKKVRKPAALPVTSGLQDASGKPKPTFILRRGDVNAPGEPVEPGFPEVLERAIALPANGTAAARRAALAGWIASPQNPLTARVMVNRIWQHHFGRGLVPTPGDFGTKGQPPTHPALLDWLASEFIKSGWSVKAMHRVMLTSATWQQTSTVGRGVLTAPGNDGIRERERRAEDSAPYQLDPANLYLSRMNRQRLEGEVIRDSLLAISGRLNLTMGGPGVFPPIPKEVLAGAKGWAQNDRAADYSRRSLYIFARRNLRFPFLEVFDAPDNNLSCSERGRSTTAPQSLTLLNATEIITASDTLAARLTRDAKTNDERVALAYRLVLGRPPTAREMELAGEFLQRSPLNEFCRALFNLNEFVYVE